jgi:hypothetical protein
MTPDPVRRIANRRRMIESLRQLATTRDREAADLRARADRLESSTDALDDELTPPQPEFDPRAHAAEVAARLAVLADGLGSVPGGDPDGIRRQADQIRRIAQGGDS